MNLMTYSHAYSLYPKATFQEKRSLSITSTSSHGQAAARQKYRERGWNVFQYVTCYEATHPRECEFAAGPRWVGDGKCMVVDLPPLESDYVPQSSPSWRSNSWNLEFDVSNEATMSQTVIPFGKWRYSVINDELEEIMDLEEVQALIAVGRLNK